MMKKHSIKDWIFAARPWSYTASTMPIILTMAFLFYSKSENISNTWINGAISVLAMIFIHASGNLISDYYDYIKNIDREETYAQKNLTSKKFTPKQILWFGYLCLFVGSILGLFVALNTHPMVIYIGIFGALSAVFYIWLKITALGDLLIFLSFGVLPVIGTAYVIDGAFDPWLLLLSLPLGTITVGILHANNTRDIEHDGVAKIKTLAMVIGKKASIIYYNLLVLSPYLVVVILIAFKILPIWSLLTFATLPIALQNIKKMKRVQMGAHEIANLDELTAKHQLTFALSWCLSLILAYYI